MAALLDGDTASYHHLRRGEIVEGSVVGYDRGGIVVDVGAKSEGIIPPQEMHCLSPKGPTAVKVGEKVLVCVVQPETLEGQILLSLDRARGEKGWRLLQDYCEQGKAFEAYATGYNRGGLLVNVEGVSAFVPLSQLADRLERGTPEATERALAEWVGKAIMLKVIELNRRRNRAILSERAALQERRAMQKDRLLQELREGDMRRGRITSVRDFGVFVDMGGADGLAHVSELSWDKTNRSPAEMFRVGDEVDVYIMKVDQEAKKIALSIRRAQPEQWDDLVAPYQEGQVIVGKVSKLAAFGAFVSLPGPVEGLVHISELADRRLNHPREVVEEGDLVPVKIVRIERERHRLSLSLRQAREKAEDEGWQFDDKGRAVGVPAEAHPWVPSELATQDEEGLTQTASLEAEGTGVTTSAPAESNRAEDVSEDQEAGAAEPSWLAVGQESAQSGS